MTSGDYWNTLSFAYLTTYSFNRGERYSELRQLLKQQYTERAEREITSLRPAYLASAGRDRQVLRDQFKQLRSKEESYWKTYNGLFDGAGAMNPTVIEGVSYPANLPEVIALAGIFQIPCVEPHAWMCPPLYRDAICFFSNTGSLLHTVDICLSCNYLMVDGQLLLSADHQVYQHLQDFLRVSGHNVDHDSASF